MTFKRQRHLIRPHAATIIGYLDTVQPTIGQPHRDLSRPGIDGVFDQFL